LRRFAAAVPVGTWLSFASADGGLVGAGDALGLRLLGV
jgi:hypothetical protein